MSTTPRPLSDRLVDRRPPDTAGLGWAFRRHRAVDQHEALEVEFWDTTEARAIEAGPDTDRD